MKKLKVWGKSNYIHNVWATGENKIHKSKVLKWCPMDTEELYQYNISNNKSLMEKLNWIDNDITYSFNEHGFRSDSFEKHCTILTNGCSQTMGIGLPLEDMWSKQIANHYNTNYHNLAVAGSDFQHLAQRSAYWLPIIKPKIYILKEPPADRFNFWNDENFEVSTAHYTEKELLKQRTLVDIVSNEANTEWYRYSSLTLIENLCKQLDIKLIVIPTTRIHPNNNESETDLARDLEHHGRIENSYTTEWIINKMKEEDYENFIN